MIDIPKFEWIKLTPEKEGEVETFTEYLTWREGDLYPVTAFLDGDDQWNMLIPSHSGEFLTLTNPPTHIMPINKNG